MNNRSNRFGKSSIQNLILAETILLSLLTTFYSGITIHNIAIHTKGYFKSNFNFKKGIAGLFFFVPFFQ